MQNCEICNHPCHCDREWCEECENESRRHLGHKCKCKAGNTDSEK